MKYVHNAAYLRSLRTVCVVVSIMALLLASAGCSMQDNSQTQDSSSADMPQGLSIVTTIFSPFDIVRTLTEGTDVSVTMLIKPGVEIHTFDPTPADIRTIQQADAIVCIGGHDEAWLDSVLEGLSEEKNIPLVVRLIECVDTLKEEHDDEHDHDEHEAHDEHEDGHVLDEHIWTSPKNVMTMASVVAEALQKLDPDNAQSYEQNLVEYEKKLDELDAALTKVVSEGERTEIVFGDRFPFRYLARDYGITWYAAFDSCSSESEPSAATIASLIDRIRTDAIPVVYHIEQGNVRTTGIISEETGAEVAQLHSCHNLTMNEFESGETYLSLMQANVEALKKGLGVRGQ